MQSDRDKMRQRLQEIDKTILVPDGLEKAVIGWAQIAGSAPIAAISFNQCVKILTEDGMSQDQALEYLEFHVISGYIGEQTPAFVYLFEENL